MKGVLGSMSIVAVCGGVAAAQPSFTGVGLLPGAGGQSWSFVVGVSGDGRTAVGHGQRFPASSALEAFRWTRPGPAAPLGIPTGSEFGSAQAASFDGRYIIGYQQYFPDIYRGFRWTAEGGYQDIGDLPGGPVSTVPSAISRDGRTIVGQGNYSFTGTSVVADAFVWTEETGIYALPGLGGSGGASEALGVSGNGRVVVGSSMGETGNRPVRWSLEDSAPFTLADLPGGGEVGNAYGVSEDGRFITGFSFSSRGPEAALWKDFGATVINLGDLPGGAVSAIGLGVTDDGSMAVGYSAASQGERGFIWDAEHGMRDAKVALQSYGLDLRGWTITRVNAITPDGMVLVGDGVHGTRNEGWIAVIPSPATAVVLGALLPMSARRRRS